MDKSPDAFRTISEVADVLDTPAHVLRFWESRFPQIRPVKRAGGRRYYRPSDVALLTGIKRLLHEEGLTIRGVQKILRDHGVRHVAGLSDDSTALDDLIAAPAEPETEVEDDVEDLTDTLAEALAQEEETGVVPEAGFIAVEEEEPAPPPARKAPAQSVLPLFDTPARRPTLREDTTFASLIRGLPSKHLVKSQSEVNTLARRLAALRATVAARADGGQG